MARLFTCGMEAGDWNAYFSLANSVAVNESGTVRTGDYSLRLNNGNSVRTTSISTGTSIYGGFALYENIPYSSGPGPIFRLLDVNGSTLATLAINNGRLYAQRQTTTIATGTITISVANWSYIEFCISIDNVTGSFATKIDGAEDINFSGDTQPSSLNVISTVEYVCPAAASLSMYFDDMVINSPAGDNNNSYPGIVRLLPDYPNNSGSATQLSRGGVDTGQNYSQVNEVPYSASQYVYGNAVDQEDLYNIQDPTIPANAEIKNIIVNAVAKVDSGAGMIALMAKSGAVQSQGSDKSIGISDKIYQEVWNIDPSTSGTWSAAAINNLEIGVKIR